MSGSPPSASSEIIQPERRGQQKQQPSDSIQMIPRAAGRRQLIACGGIDRGEADVVRHGEGAAAVRVRRERLAAGFEAETVAAV